MDRLLDLDALEALQQVTVTGSFEGAAEKLGITQSAVSQRVKNYEKKTGVQLIRRGKPCMPTEIGEKFLEFRRKITHQEATLQTEVDVERGEWAQGAHIIVVVSNDMLAYWFTTVMSRASEELDIVFEIQTNEEIDPEALLRSGKAHATLSFSATTYKNRGRVSIDHRPLGALEYVAVASRDFFNAHFAEGVSSETLSRAACIAYSRCDPLPDEWLLGALGAKIPLKTQFVPSSRAHIRSVRKGAGWGLVPVSCVSAHLASGKLIELVPSSSVLVSLHWHAAMTGTNRVMRNLTKIVKDVALVSLVDDDYRGFGTAKPGGHAKCVG